MSGKNTAKLAAKYNMPIVTVMVRGGTHHRKDIFLSDGRKISVWPDGYMEYKGIDCKCVDIADQVRQIEEIDRTGLTGTGPHTGHLASLTA